MPAFSRHLRGQFQRELNWPHPLSQTSRQCHPLQSSTHIPIELYYVLRMGSRAQKTAIALDGVFRDVVVVQGGAKGVPFLAAEMTFITATAWSRVMGNAPPLRIAL